MATNH